jgi:hypothetical protein
MALSGDLNNYLSAMKTAKKKDVDLKISDNRQALTKQGRKCAICKKDLNPYYSKYIKDPKTKEVKVICSNCAVSIPQR